MSSVFSLVVAASFKFPFPTSRSAEHALQATTGVVAPPPFEYAFSASTAAAVALYRGCNRSVTEKELAATEAEVGARRPDLVLIGTQKGGTTGFASGATSVMCQSAGGFEVHFFDDNRFRSNPVRKEDIGQYLGLWRSPCASSSSLALPRDQLPNFEKEAKCAAKTYRSKD